MKKPSLKQILVLHEYQIKKHGGSHGVRDMSMLDSAINRPFATFGGQDLYRNIFTKSAALIQSIVENHPFLDGNKRTAFTSAYAFLKSNGIQITASKEDCLHFMLLVTNENLSVDEISIWLQDHSKMTK